jgi:hypothetical protein
VLSFENKHGSAPSLGVRAALPYFLDRLFFDQPMIRTFIPKISSIAPFLVRILHPRTCSEISILEGMFDGDDAEGACR